MVHPSFELVCWACGQLLGAAPNAGGLLQLDVSALSLQAELSSQVTDQPSVPSRAPDPLSVGRVWPVRDGLELSLFLTPTPERCAPLLEMTF